MFLGMVRTTRNSNIAMLLPAGDDLLDSSFEIIAAIQHANTILTWHENLPEEEMPPEWMWPFPDELEEHFAEVKWARKQKYNGSGGDDDDWGMVENEWSHDD